MAIFYLVPQGTAWCIICCNYDHSMVVGQVWGMFTPFPGPIQTCVNMPRNTISASTPIIARTPCDASKTVGMKSEGDL